MMNRNERMEKLNQAGINTSKYFTVDLDNGTKIHLIIDENGQHVVVNGKEPDPIAEQIFANGYVKNTKLHRRYVMAQMFYMLNYKSYDGKDEGYTGCLNRTYGYQYTFDMMLEEVRVLSKLEKSDKESFEERSHFFTKEVVVEVACDYIEKLKAYVDSLSEKKCKGVPYKRIKGQNIFVVDLDKKLYRPLMSKILYIRYATNYNSLYKALDSFMESMIKLPFETRKSKVWVDAFKGEGSYYTLKNLIMFHNCAIDDNGNELTGIAAKYYLNLMLDDYQGEGWRMFALMKKVIIDNNFDYSNRMHELGVKGY